MKRLVPWDWPDSAGWPQRMAADLKSKNHFDDAIPFDWIYASTVWKPGLAEQAGKTLASKIEQYRAQKSSQHPGDVVDVHLIGHSRS